MHVALDVRPLHNQSAGRGIGVYTEHLYKYLQSTIPGIRMSELSEGKTPQDVDLLHYPFFDLFFMTLPWIKKKPTVVTIHDVTPLVLPELYPSGVRGKLKLRIQKFSLKTTKAVITDSESSKRDIAQYLQYPASKIHVVSLAPQDGLLSRIDAELIDKVRNIYTLPANFVLYVGDINPNKNIPTLIEACQKLGIPLVIVGKAAVRTKYDKEHPENQDLVAVQKAARQDETIRLLGYVPAAELSALYHLATVYCQPSLYEGFGIPVLEAMHCGCPVVASKVGSLEEIGGTAAVYVAPTTEKIAKGINFILNLTGAQRQRLVQEGKKQVSKFTWERAAKETYAVYTKVMVGS